MEKKNILKEIKFKITHSKFLAFFLKLKSFFPTVAALKSFWEKLTAFHFRPWLCKKCLKLSQKLKWNKAASFFEKRLDVLSDIKSNVLRKYISKELFIYFIVLFLAFFMIFFVNHILLVAETLFAKNVPLHSVIRLMWYILPSIVAQSAPYATLVGFLMCLGRMATDNEILILRASGQRYGVIFKPVIVMSVVISLVSFVMNDYFLPLGTIKYNQYYRRVITANPAIELEPHSVKRMNDSVLVIGDVQKNHVSDLVFISTDKNGNQRMIISGPSNILKSTSPGVVMQLQMNDSFVIMFNKNMRDKYEVLDSEGMTLNVFESSFTDASGGTAPREMTSLDLLKKIIKMKKSNRTQKNQLNYYMIEFYRKYSVPFGSFFFAILAFPLALVFGKSNGQLLGLVFGLVICLLNWVMSILGQMFGIRGGYNAFLVTWLPHILVSLIGILIYLRLVKK